MKYLLMITYDEVAEQNKSPDEGKATMDAYFAYTNELMQSGKMVGGEALDPTTAATTVRVKNGEVVTTDGPFAETKEQIGGYYVIDVDNLDDAIKWAAKIPHASKGSIEVRPVMNVNMPTP
jgi:hypothetical protein